MLTFDERLMNFLPLGIYMSTKAWIYYTWFAYVTLVVSPLSTVAFVLSSTGLWYNFLKAWRADPGIVRTSQEVGSLKMQYSKEVPLKGTVVPLDL